MNHQLEALMIDCTFLNAFYIEARYPVHWPTQYTKDMALNARRAVEQIRTHIVPLIESRVKQEALLSETSNEER